MTPKTSSSSSSSVDCGGAARAFDSKSAGGARITNTNENSGGPNTVGHALRAACSDDVYHAEHVIPRHHKRLASTRGDVTTDDVIKNDSKSDAADVAAESPSRDRGCHGDRKKTNECTEVKQEVSKR